MKRFIILLLILVAAVIFFLNKADIQIVSARGESNPNFVTHEEVSNVVQTNIDLLWNELNNISSRLDSIETRLDALEN